MLTLGGVVEPNHWTDPGEILEKPPVSYEDSPFACAQADEI